MDTQYDRNEKKFAEPRGWSAKWCGHGLGASQGQPESAKNSSNDEKFAEPRGWATKWCGAGLFRGQKR
jgi:hypothetical protein